MNVIKLKLSIETHTPIPWSDPTFITLQLIKDLYLWILTEENFTTIYACCGKFNSAQRYDKEINECKEKTRHGGYRQSWPWTWGKPIPQTYGDLVEFVGLCGHQLGRGNMQKIHRRRLVKPYTDFDDVLSETKTRYGDRYDRRCNLHHEFIINRTQCWSQMSLQKPLTTDEVKVQKNIDAERKSGKKVIVAFNYRHNPHANEN